MVSQCSLSLVLFSLHVLATIQGLIAYINVYIIYATVRSSDVDCAKLGIVRASPLP